MELIKKHELAETWCHFNHHRQYTWAHARDYLISLARFDRFYCFKHQLNIFRNCTITPVSFSDHSMFQCSVGMRLIKPRSAYWHFNTTLLSDANFRIFHLSSTGGILETCK